MYYLCDVFYTQPADIYTVYTRQPNAVLSASKTYCMSALSEYVKCGFSEGMYS